MSTPAGTFADPFDAGPYARLQAALGLMGPSARRVSRRAVIAAAIAWVPLVVLAAAEGLAIRPDPRESMLLDIAMHVRYLVSIPALVIAEVACLPRLARIAHHFGAAGLIPESERQRYDALLDSTRRLLRSRPAEVVIVLLAYATTLAFSQVWYPATVSTWVAPISAGVRSISLAGWWRTLVSQPLFGILLMIWLWRLIVWALFLWRIARLDLRLIPAHPDLSGGLAFVATSLRAFQLVAFALAAPLAGSVASGLLYGAQAELPFRNVVVIALAVVLVLCAAPLLAFFRPLVRARATGIFEYGQLAAALGRRFEEKWIESRNRIDPSALDANDFSATTDLYSVTANVRAMRLLPVDLRGLVPLVVATLLPFVPVLFMMMPVEQVIQAVIKLLR